MDRSPGGIQVLPILNNKGGVGKTTTCVNLAAGLARNGHRVLIVDLDGQCSASRHLGIEQDDSCATSADVLFGTASLGSAVRRTPTPDLHILPGSLALAQADVVLGSGDQPVSALAAALEPARPDYDYILVDCAPTVSLLQVNVLVAADALIVPVSLSYLAVKGLDSFGMIARRVWAARRQMTPVLGILRTMYDPGAPAQQKMAAAVLRQYGGKVFQATVHDCDEVASASRAHRTLFEHAPDAQGAADYAALAVEVQERSSRYARVFSPNGHLPAERESAVAEAAFGPAWAAA